jgi:hypothetical protein
VVDGVEAPDVVARLLEGGEGLVLEAGLDSHDFAG